MHTVDFMQKIFLLVLSGYITYLVSIHLMHSDTQVDNARLLHITKYAGKGVQFSHHEQQLLDDIYLPSELKIKMDDIYGLQEEKNKIQRAFFGKPHNIFKDVQKGDGNGVLLYGLPGTGKTMMAQALANESQVPLICFNISNIENKLLGESNKTVQALFTLAQKLKPCMLFIDEIDCICGTRNMLDQSHVNTMKSVLLTYMDGIASDKGITFIGATNRMDAIDPAFKRRIPIHVEIPLPDVETIQHMLRSTINTDDKTIEDISMICLGLSCSDIKQLCHLVSTTYEEGMSLLESFNANSRLVHV